MTTWTTQDIFNRVINHLIGQGDVGNYLNALTLEGERNWAFVNPNNPCQRCAKGVLHQVYLTASNTYLTSENLKTSAYKEVRDTAPLELINRQITDKEVCLLNEIEVVFERKPYAEFIPLFQKIATKHGLEMPEFKPVDLKAEMRAKGFTI